MFRRTPNLNPTQNSLGMWSVPTRRFGGDVRGFLKEYHDWAMGVIILVSYVFFGTAAFAQSGTEGSFLISRPGFAMLGFLNKTGEPDQLRIMLEGAVFSQLKEIKGIRVIRNVD